MHTRAAIRLLALLLFAALLTPGVASAESCPNEAFRTGPSAVLPECRAYELVTPAFKNGGLVLHGTEIDQAKGWVGLDGEGVPFYSSSSFAGNESPGGLNFVNYVSERSAVGWLSRSVTLPAAQFVQAEGLTGIEGYSSRNDREVLRIAQAFSGPENELDFYLVGPGGSVVDVGPVLPPSAPPLYRVDVKQDGLTVDGVSAEDASHIIFHLEGENGELGLGGGGGAPALWPFAGAHTLLEYVGSGNTEPMLVGVNDEGGFADGCPSQELGGQQIGYTGPPLEVGGRRVISNAVSADGSTVFFSDKCRHELFARIDNGQPGAHTVAISEPSREDCAACDTEAAVRQSGYYLGASEDGSKVFFATTQPLLGSDSSLNIYEYDFDAPAGERVVRVTAGDSTVSNPTADVQGVVQVAPDGSHIYFVAAGVLSSTPNYAGAVAQAGADNLYVYERDAQYPAGRIVFVAAMQPGEGHLWEADPSPSNSEAGSVVSSEGRFLAFVSGEHLTPDDASPSGQLFEYDAQANTMRRVSIGQGGFNDNGNTSSFGQNAAFAVASDGVVFFENEAGLTPQALNFHQIGFASEPSYAENIYEYKGERVYLISDGLDVTTGFGGGLSSVQLLGAGASGQDVFFTTDDRLVGQDTDSQLDIYDARVDGGFPAPAAPVECQADACQGQLSAAPVLLSPGSEFQAGGENVGSASVQPVTPTVSVKAHKAKTKVKKKKKKRKGGKVRGKAKRSSARGAGRGR